MAKKQLLTILWLLLVTAVLSSCRQETSPETEMTPTASVAQTISAPTPTNTQLTPVQQPTAVPPPTITPPLLATTDVAPEPLFTGEGALIQLTMESQVGVLLDEIPSELRDEVATALMARPDAYWIAQAQQQVQLTKNRLYFRNFFYANKGQLPLPPKELWTFSLDDAGPARQTIAGHDLIMIDYTFTSTLLTDPASPAAAEPALEKVGGTWEEPFVFPADPDFLLQRTGNACVNEGGFPPNSFDSENIAIYYDYTCQADSGGAGGCHRTRLPTLSCREALTARVGEVETVMRFERLAWDAALAGRVRTGNITPVETPDLAVVGADLATNRIIYRYIAPNSCALGEQSVGDSGWRRLLQFDATVYNVGGQPLHIGPVIAEDPLRNAFRYDSCHDHFHFSNYGIFSLDNVAGAVVGKRAFCVQSTNRFSNNELSPLTHPYTCQFQGIQAGWADEYGAGLDSQWIDITDVEVPDSSLAVQLTFISNSDQFLCEGTPVLDDEGAPLWEPSGLTTETGLPISRPQCLFTSAWDANNRASREVVIPPTGSFVTAPCANGEIGPLRNCGFVEQTDDLSCQPGQPAQITHTAGETAIPQVARVCEASAVLDTGVACAYEDALANVVADQNETTIEFTCPGPRDAEEPGGRYSLYTAPLYEDDTP